MIQHWKLSVFCVLSLTIGTLQADDRVSAVRERLVRRQICDLRREAIFVQHRISRIPDQRDQTLLHLRNGVSTPDLERQVTSIYAERERRLQERLNHVTAELAAAHERLVELRAAEHLDVNLLPLQLFPFIPIPTQVDP